MVESSPWLCERDWAIGAGVLALAGAFQFTPLKDACLDKCRHPAQFLRRYYSAAWGARFAPARHGAFLRPGCCWALMLVMFAAGVPSLIWMALLTALMVHEKTRTPGGRPRGAGDRGGAAGGGVGGVRVRAGRMAPRKLGLESPLSGCGATW